MYYVFLDFEATCIPDRVIDDQEIIEFPMVVTDENFNVIDEFHEYVRPVVNPKLTRFCTELTGIRQETVDSARTFPEVYKSACQFLEDHAHRSYFIVTCGWWDMRTMLPKQLKLSKLKLHPRFNVPLVNMKVVYKDKKGLNPKSLIGMAESMGLTFEGRLHSGIDDTRNMVQIYKALHSL